MAKSRLFNFVSNLDILKSSVILPPLNIGNCQIASLKDIFARLLSQLSLFKIVNVTSILNDIKFDKPCHKLFPISFSYTITNL